MEWLRFSLPPVACENHGKMRNKRCEYTRKCSILAISVEEFVSFCHFLIYLSENFAVALQTRATVIKEQMKAGT